MAVSTHIPSILRKINEVPQRQVRYSLFSIIKGYTRVLETQTNGEAEHW